MIKVKKRKILLLPGDGIGPEVIGEVKKIINWFNDKKSLDFEIDEDLAGGCSYDKHGTPITDEVFYKALESAVVMLGAVGGPKWDNLEFSKKPERALLKLRKELKLFANLRPAICFKQLVDASTLKPEIVSGLDIMIVRELTGGIYFGQPKRTESLDDGDEQALDTMVYKTSEIQRIAEVAVKAASLREGKICSVDKANVLETSVLWRKVVTDFVNQTNPSIELSHMYVDNAAMQLVRNPNQFDVILTENMFGDILSDELAVICGSLGMLASASLGTGRNSFGLPFGLYEPAGGTAPDIAGKNLANPCAQILSAALMLRYSFGMEDEAQSIETAVKETIRSGFRTGDISVSNDSVSTEEMGKAVIERLA